MTPTFKSRRKPPEVLIAEAANARASRLGLEPCPAPLWIGIDLGGKEETVIAEVPPRHPATGIGE